ncbi:MAG: bifunctional precorrin-2 dehydrogenase/sirohydrochlorin ferrochelatase [Proteobacteria bacterium]|nr:bifunctional precorrin-2 dehydrogenase/sirohydrochlorin ferrochelatase [Pseudomonadota bacterium]
MKYYPVCLNIKGRQCLVIGGGSVGTRKAETLFRCGASVTVISPDISDGLQSMAGANKIVLEIRDYDPQDLEGMFLVFCATNNMSLNQRIAGDAEQRGILCNSADLPEESDFILPSLVERGDLTIAISTAGTSPAFAKKLRKDLSEQFGQEYADFLALMGIIRKKLLAEAHDPQAHKRLFEQLIGSKLLEMLKEKNQEAVHDLLQAVLGPGFSHEDLYGHKEQ